jgi:DNA-binding transcriptional ArsR family regulator
MIEYTVLWHGGMKDTYLCVREPNIRPIDGVLGWSKNERFGVFDILPTCREDAITIGQIQERSGASYSSASQTLFRLRRDGILQSEMVKGKVGSGQRPRLYWRRAV